MFCSKCIIGFAMLWALGVNSQELKAEILLKGGKTLVGFAETTTRNVIKYRPERKGKKEVLNYEIVDTLKLYFLESPSLYVFQKTDDKSTPRLLEIIIKGPKVVYYRDNTGGYSPTSVALYPKTSYQRTVPVNLKNSFLRKVTEDTAIHLGKKEWDFSRFRQSAAAYFSDCEALVRQINHKETTKRNLLAIINFYNNSCF